MSWPEKRPGRNRRDRSTGRPAGPFFFGFYFLSPAAAVGRGFGRLSRRRRSAGGRANGNGDGGETDRLRRKPLADMERVYQKKKNNNNNEGNRPVPLTRVFPLTCFDPATRTVRGSNDETVRSAVPAPRATRFCRAFVSRPYGPTRTVPPSPRYRTPTPPGRGRSRARARRSHRCRRRWIACAPISDASPGG